MMNPPLLVFLLFLSTVGVAGWDDLPIRINCGSASSDFGFTGGLSYDSGYVPSVSPFPLVTGRYFPRNSFGRDNCYTFQLQSGFYSIRVFFGIRYNAVPVFVVSMKGTIVRSLNSDWNEHVEQTFLEISHFVGNDEEFMCFHYKHSSPTILSIEVYKLLNLFPFATNEIYRTHSRMNFGTNVSNFDQNLDFGYRFWKGIWFLSDNGISVNTSQSILVSDQYPSFIYETGIIATTSLPDLIFVIRQLDPMKMYIFSLHFCHIFGSSGSAVFEIRLGGNTVHRAFDVLGMAGGFNRPVVVNYSMYATSTSLMVYLKAAKGSIAFINALEIHEVIKPEFNTLYSEVLALRKIKRALGISSRFGWNGDPCAPDNYPWVGVNCSLDKKLNIQNVIGLTLVKKSLKGNLPEEFSEFSCLEFLDLSNNEFEGSIPNSYLGLRRLRLLNLSGNLLHGQVPRFSKSISLSLDGNLDLCGYAGLPSCGGKISGAVLLLAAVSILLVLLVSLLALELRSKIGKFH